MKPIKIEGGILYKAIQTALKDMSVGMVDVEIDDVCGFIGSGETFPIKGVEVHLRKRQAFNEPTKKQAPMGYAPSGKPLTAPAGKLRMVTLDGVAV